jgi:hypothetical protein
MSMQLPNETAKAYAAFLVYAEMGPERSVKAVSQKTSKSIPLLKRWSRKHKWVKRVTEWDQAAEKRRHEAEEKAMHAEAAEWARRQRKVREKDYQTAQALREKAAEMLKYPIAEKRVSKDGKVTTIKAGRWSMADVIRGLQVASQLERLSCGLATEKTELTGADNTPIVPVNSNPVVIVLPDNGRDKPAAAQ